MAVDRGVTLRAQWLGQILRSLREQRKLTLKDAAEYLQRTVSTVSRFESGIYPIRRVDVLGLMDLYHVQDKQQRDILTQLANDLWQTGWWEKYSEDDNIWGSTIDLVWLESRAERLRSFSALTVHGLLQTADYARSLMRVVDPDVPDAEIERGVDLRLGRQRILERETNPVRMSVVFDEAALRRRIGGSDVMSAQLRHLLALNERGVISTQVIPFEVGAHASPEGTFTLIKMEDPFPEVAYVESRGGAMYLESDDADKLSEVNDQLQESALSAEKSAAFIAALEKDLS
jgi:transcriptional regulator with XRE-family HTH domain